MCEYCGSSPRADWELPCQHKDDTGFSQLSENSGSLTSQTNAITLKDNLNEEKKEEIKDMNIGKCTASRNDLCELLGESFLKELTGNLPDQLEPENTFGKRIPDWPGLNLNLV